MSGYAILHGNVGNDDRSYRRVILPFRTANTSGDLVKPGSYTAKNWAESLMLFHLGPTVPQQRFPSNQREKLRRDPDTCQSVVSKHGVAPTEYGFSDCDSTARRRLHYIA